MKAVVFIMALALAGMARAWSINGHLFVANIAQDILLQNDPDSWDAANEMLTYYADAYPEDVTHEDMHPFVECSTFADDMKYHGEAW